MARTTERPAVPRHHAVGPEAVVLGLLALIGLGFVAGDHLDTPLLRSWSTIFVSICVQALPFLALGVVISAAIAAFVPAQRIGRLLPSKPALAVPAAGLAGMALPGCECGAVPIAGRLIAAGARPAAGLTFLLAAPAVNPVVLMSTAVAFPGQPTMVAARFTASMLTAVIVGWVWLFRGREDLVTLPRGRPTTGRRPDVFREVAVHDLLHAGGFLVFGAMAAATFQVLIPQELLDRVGGHAVLSVVTLAAFAVLLSICSEADAFVAASLQGFSKTSLLVFMVVGPTVDVKLVSMQAGVFSRRFASRFAPITLVTAVIVAVVIGSVLL
jgi:uncharacterized protein